MRILIVDDDIDYLSNCIAEIEKDYVVDVAYSASDGCFKSEVNDYDVIVVDGSLPSDDSEYFCKSVREANISSPILYLDKKFNCEERLNRLRDGANVCIPKDVSVLELKAQIKALIKLKHAYFIKNEITLAGGLIKIDFVRQKIVIAGIDISIRKKEFSIIEYLVLNKGRIVTKEELLDHIWEDGILVKSNSLEVHMRNIRAKIEKPYNVKVFNTIRGFGYRVD